MPKSIPKIVLTGGACGGKSTMVEHLREELPKHNATPVFLPELATMLNLSGLKWLDVANDPDSALRFQINMVKMQLSNEDWYEALAMNVAEHRKNVVLICDRGAMDNFAYLPDEAHDNLERYCGITQEKIKSRYDGIIHLQTLAAIGGFELNNPARYEAPEEAIRMCDRTYALWRKSRIGTYHVRVNASVSLQEKKERVLEHVMTILTIQGYHL
jgi:thymidylate kinase